MTVTVEQAQSSLKELIAKISSGEKVLITQGAEPIAELVAVTGATGAPVFGSCKGMLTIVAEDEQHLEDFAEYMK
jgi:antitoxin (DNA-binding transcriptional repressor) of toxin-antitoxin stability system